MRKPLSAPGYPECALALASAFAGGSGTFDVTDSDVLTLQLSLEASSVAEGTAITATVRRNSLDVSTALSVSLTSGNTSEASVPDTVTIPADARTATFTITGVSDFVHDPDRIVTVSAAATDFVSGDVVVVVTNIEPPRPSPLTLTADVWPDTGITILLEGADLRLIETGTTNDVARRPFSQVSEITVAARDDADDELNVDFGGGNPIPVGGLSYSGGDGSGSDSLRLGNGTVLQVGHVFESASSGQVIVDSRTLTYAGLEPIVDELATDVRTMTFGNTADVVVLSDTGTGSDGLLRLDGDNSEQLDFLVPADAVTINLGAGDDQLRITSLEASFATQLIVNGDAGSDTLDASAVSAGVTLNGGEDNDALTGGNGNDQLNGQAGTDTLVATQQTGETFLLTNSQLDGLSNDTLSSIEQAELNGNADDNLIVAVTFSGNVTVLAGAGQDTVLSGSGNDLLEGGPGEDQLEGFGGNDTILGQGDGDTLLGGTGLDSLVGGDGDDRVDGQTDNDVVLGGPGDDSLFGGPGNDHLESEAGDDVFRGGSGNDSLFGGDENDQLFGEDGDDELHGEGGNDLLDGGAGNDIIIGGDGNDRLRGGSGVNDLRGEGGRDTVVNPTVSDSVVGNPVSIDLRTVLTATTINAAGEVSALPQNAAYLDEWDEFFVEVCGSTPADAVTSVEGFEVALSFDADLFTATTIDFGPAFANAPLSSIDGTSGVVSLNADASLTDAGRDNFVLLSRVAFVPRANGDLANNITGSYILPRNNVRFEATDVVIETTGGIEADANLLATTSRIWPVMYDLDDSGSIGFGDLSFLAAAFGRSITTDDTAYLSDFDRSGTVGFGDVALFAQNLGRSAGLTARQAYATNFPNAWTPQPQALLAGNGTPAIATSRSSDLQPLSPQTLSELQDAAVDRFEAAGVAQSDLDELRSIDIHVQDLPDGYLGLATDDAIIVDIDANGSGWFIDDTPDNDAEFTIFEQSAVASTAAARERFDVLTVIAHELGHHAGWNHDDAGFMSDRLSPGERRLPRSAEADDQFAVFADLDELLGL